MNALEPRETYFVVFRYGAVVLFQGTGTPLAASASGVGMVGALRTQAAHAVRPPSGAPHPQGPWDAGEQEWRSATEAAWEAHDSQLIFLLLRPFMRDVSVNQDVRCRAPAHHPLLATLPHGAVGAARCEAAGAVVPPL